MTIVKKAVLRKLRRACKKVNINPDLLAFNEYDNVIGVLSYCMSRKQHNIIMAHIDYLLKQVNITNTASNGVYGTINWSYKNVNS